VEKLETIRTNRDEEKAEEGRTKNGKGKKKESNPQEQLFTLNEVATWVLKQTLTANICPALPDLDHIFTLTQCLNRNHGRPPGMLILSVAVLAAVAPNIAVIEAENPTVLVPVFGGRGLEECGI
jgi:hypothetical protein